MIANACTWMYKCKAKEKKLCFSGTISLGQRLPFLGENNLILYVQVKGKKNTLFLRQNLIRSKAGILLGEQFDFICVTLPKKVDNLKEERD